MKTQREQREKRHREGIAALQLQVREGSLIIRQMTEAERARYPARKRDVSRRA
jgi:hypothetical protein